MARFVMDLQGIRLVDRRALACARSSRRAAFAVLSGMALILASLNPGLAQTVPAPAAPQVAAPVPPAPPSAPKAKEKAKPPSQAQTNPSPAPAARTPNAAKTGSGGLNLDLRAQEPEKKTGKGGVADSPGTFSASGPYASQALINRVTGKIKQGELPKSPISLGGVGSADQNVGPAWAR